MKGVKRKFNRGGRRPSVVLQSVNSLDENALDPEPLNCIEELDEQMEVQVHGRHSLSVGKLLVTVVDSVSTRRFSSVDCGRDPRAEALMWQNSHPWEYSPARVPELAVRLQALLSEAFSGDECFMHPEEAIHPQFCSPRLHPFSALRETRAARIERVKAFERQDSSQKTSEIKQSFEFLLATSPHVLDAIKQKLLVTTCPCKEQMEKRLRDMEEEPTDLYPMNIPETMDPVFLCALTNMEEVPHNLSQTTTDRTKPPDLLQMIRNGSLLLSDNAQPVSSKGFFKKNFILKAWKPKYKSGVPEKNWDDDSVDLRLETPSPSIRIRAKSVPNILSQSDSSEIATRL
ncbi:unnamed protein product [Notodromas monacha]|uniref:Uncharacterized protein n=1 Tax=Notodromas monacha TaxID=399045 RepID=A0A7R9G9U6_9CRUS|nr:unnamed protein product [Notodromas monacha]CAG0913441.1 unnamed protein product [Notodromas monacha]